MPHFNVTRVRRARTRSSELIGKYKEERLLLRNLQMCVFFLFSCIVVGGIMKAFQSTKDDARGKSTTSPDFEFLIFFLNEILTIFEHILMLILNLSLRVLAISGSCFEFIQANFPFEVTSFALFCLACLGYYVLGLLIAKLWRNNVAISNALEALKLELKQKRSNAELKREQLVEQHSEVLKEIEVLKATLEKTVEENAKLKTEQQNWVSLKRTLKLEAQEKEKLNTNLEINKKKLKADLEKKQKENMEYEAKESKLKSQIDELNINLREANDLSLNLETELTRMDSQNKKLTSKLEEEKDKLLCDICADNYKNILLLPCKHFTMCNACLNHNKWSKCPICRENIKSTMDVFS